MCLQVIFHLWRKNSCCNWDVVWIFSLYWKSLRLLHKLCRWQSESKGLYSDSSPELPELGCTCSPLPLLSPQTTLECFGAPVGVLDLHPAHPCLLNCDLQGLLCSENLTKTPQEQHRGLCFWERRCLLSWAACSPWVHVLTGMISGEGGGV